MQVRQRRRLLLVALSVLLLALLCLSAPALAEAAKSKKAASTAAASPKASDAAPAPVKPASAEKKAKASTEGAKATGAAGAAASTADKKAKKAEKPSSSKPQAETPKAGSPKANETATPDVGKAAAPVLNNAEDPALSRTPEAIARQAQADADAKARLAARKADPKAVARAARREKRAAVREAQALKRKLAIDKARKRNANLAQKRHAAKQRVEERAAKRRTAEDARRQKRTEAAKPEVIARGQEKLRWLARATEQASSAKESRVIDVSASQFKKYVHTSPRPYWLFVVFTALGSRYTCAICHNAAPEIKTLAQVYYNDRMRVAQELKANGTGSVTDLLTVPPLSPETGGWDAETKQRMPVFFVQVDIDNCGEVFRALGMQSAPTMVMLPPTAAASVGPLPALLSSLPSKNKFVLMKAEMSAADLNEFVGKVVGQAPSLTTTRAPGLAGWVQLVSAVLNLMDPVRYLLLCVASAMLCLLALLYSLQRLYSMVQQRRARSLRAQGIVSRELSPSELVTQRVFSQYSAELAATSLGTPSLTRSTHAVAPLVAFVKPRRLGLFRWWFVLAGCLVYLFGISGCMFTILRGRGGFPSAAAFWSQPLRRMLDVWQYIEAGDSHDQSALEGLALGLLQLALASILVLLNRTAFTERLLRPPSAAPLTLAERAKAVLRWLLSLLLSPLLWGTLFFLTWRTVVAIYSKKNPSYKHGFVWKHWQPSHFKPMLSYLQRAVAYLPPALRAAVYKVF